MKAPRFWIAAVASAAFLVLAGAASAAPVTINVAPTGGGSGSVVGTQFAAGADVVNCTWNGAVAGGDCTMSVEEGSTVRFTATPAAGSIFSDWGGSCPAGSQSGPNGSVCEFPADARTLTPRFELDVDASVTVAPQGAGPGTVTATGDDLGLLFTCTWNGTTTGGTCTAPVPQASLPETITLTATPGAGATFGGYTNCPGTVSGPGDTICTFTLFSGTDDPTVGATFLGPDVDATLTVAPQGAGTGVVTGTGPGGTVINCTWDGTTASGDCTETVGTGQGGQFTLVANPTAGSTAAWTNCPGTVSADGLTCTLTIDDPGDDFTVRPSFGERPLPPGCTIAGTEGDDILVGTEGRDVICGLGGNDTIRGMGGGDELLGGPGDDVIFGGDGSDDISGGSGNDNLNGNKGSDDISGGVGNDRLAGGNGTDSLSGGTGADVLFGGNGSDALAGGGGNDTMYGNRGSDVLSGGRGRDRAFGGPGNDLCTAERRVSC